MTAILKLLLVSSCLVTLSCAVDIEQSFKDAKIVPDIVPESPSSLAWAEFPDGSIVNLGNSLDVTAIQTEPEVTWTTIPDALYTLAIIDPEAPVKVPDTNVFIHFLKVNIKADDLESGRDVFEYMFTAPVGSPHRYIVLVYQQDAKIEDDLPTEMYEKVNVAERSKYFSKFIQKYSTTAPVAGNFYKSSIEAPL